MTSWADIRKQCGFTQPEMAQYLGVSRSSYGMFEQGRSPINARAVQRLAILLSTINSLDKEATTNSNVVSRQCSLQLAERISDCRALASRYRQQITEMQERYAELQKMRQLLQKLSDSGQLDTISSSFVGQQQHLLVDKMAACDADACFILQCRMEILLAEANVLVMSIKDNF